MLGFEQWALLVAVSHPPIELGMVYGIHAHAQDTTLVFPLLLHHTKQHIAEWRLLAKQGNWSSTHLDLNYHSLLQLAGMCVVCRAACGALA